LKHPVHITKYINNASTETQIKTLNAAASIKHTHVHRHIKYIILRFSQSSEAIIINDYKYSEKLSNHQPSIMNIVQIGYTTVRHIVETLKSHITDLNSTSLVRIIAPITGVTLAIAPEVFLVSTA